MTVLKPFINHRFNGQIWKFVIDEHACVLIAEIRSANNKQTSFASIGLLNGVINFEDLVLLDGWLSGLEGCYNGIVLFHGYQSPQSPAHKGITAAHSSTGKILWTDYNMAVHYIGVNGPVAYSTQLQPRKLFLADVQNGAMLRPLDASIDVAQKSKITLPDILPTLPQCFSNFFVGEVNGNVLYVERNDFRIVSLHCYKQGLLQQLLLIINNNQLVYSDILNDKIQKLQPEAFIIYDNLLICVKNADQLQVINL